MVVCRNKKRSSTTTLAVIGFDDPCEPGPAFRMRADRTDLTHATADVPGVALATHRQRPADRNGIVTRTATLAFGFLEFVLAS
jgi:hypothetical protein